MNNNEDKGQIINNEFYSKKVLVGELIGSYKSIPDFVKNSILWKLRNYK